VDDTGKIYFPRTLNELAYIAGRRKSFGDIILKTSNISEYYKLFDRGCSGGGSDRICIEIKYDPHTCTMNFACNRLTTTFYLTYFALEKLLCRNKFIYLFPFSPYSYLSEPSLSWQMMFN
jgi:hypothetical protein